MRFLVFYRYQCVRSVRCAHMVVEADTPDDAIRCVEEQEPGATVYDVIESELQADAA